MFYNKAGDFMKNKLSLFYKILIVVVSSIALWLNFKIMPFKEGILYFTLQSNLLCCLYYFVITVLKLLKKEVKNNFYYRGFLKSTEFTSVPPEIVVSEVFINLPNRYGCL